jgi:hypothetical protein
MIGEIFLVKIGTRHRHKKKKTHKKLIQSSFHSESKIKNYYASVKDAV